MLPSFKTATTVSSLCKLGLSVGQIISLSFKNFDETAPAAPFILYVSIIALFLKYGRATNIEKKIKIFYKIFHTFRQLQHSKVSNLLDAKKKRREL